MMMVMFLRDHPVVMSITRRSLAALPLGALLAPVLARAQGTVARPTVVELFTSQGCSSCPPADALMVELSKEPGMIPLTYPVQIWDYLGWRDTLAKPDFTRRQRAYAENVAGKRVYTPQAIVNGRAHCVGSDFSSIVRLKGATAEASTTRIRIRWTGDGWTATVMFPDGAGPAHLILLPVMSREVVQIGRGENSGRSVTYANVVRAIRDLGSLAPGEKTIRVSRSEIGAEGADGFALLIQAGDIASPGIVLAGAIAGPEGVKA
jgi:hypothetical protein